MDMRESFYDAVWDGKSDLAEMIRIFHKQKLENELPNRKDLWDKLTPKYNPGCKRVIITDDYFPALGLPNVSLETRPISEISGNKVKVKDDNGKIEDAEPGDFDLLVCATGFKTVEFMHPINMTGRNGRSIRDVWQVFAGIVSRETSANRGQRFLGKMVLKPITELVLKICRILQCSTVRIPILGTIRLLYVSLGIPLL